jgi:hypothetical protein
VYAHTLGIRHLALENLHLPSSWQAIGFFGDTCLLPFRDRFFCIPALSSHISPCNIKPYASLPPLLRQRKVEPAAAVV